MAERIKSRTKWNKTGQHTNNHWNDYSTDKEDSQLEVSRTGWIHGYRLKNLPALNERISIQVDDMINNGMDIPKWMATGKTIICQKYPGRGNAVDNYWPILCLPLMWKLISWIIANSVYEYLEMYNLLPVEEKGCRRNSLETKDQFLIDKMVLNDCKKRHTNLGMVWIHYKKAYDMIPHSWILESLGFVQESKNIVEFIRKFKRMYWGFNL